MKKLLFLTLFLTLNFLTYAQFEAGLSLGLTSYSGDIDFAIKNTMKQSKPVGGVFGRYYLTPSLAIRGQAYFGQLYADEKKYSNSSYRKQRGFSFNSPITEFSIQGEWHALKLDRYFTFEDEDPFISLYGFGGGGMSLFNPQTDYNEPNTIVDDVSVDRDASFSKTVPSLIGGMGIRIAITDQLGFGGEFGGRKIFTDYLDGISRLSGAAKDYYYFGTLTLSWKFEGGGGGLNLFSGRGGRGGNWGKSSRRVGCPNF